MESFHASEADICVPQNHHCQYMTMHACCTRFKAASARGHMPRGTAVHEPART
jgi:hypothetical protein